ncbi:MAG: hypothetical protein QOG42_654 [Solirubrobacteraceae bacterium]|nr:hypothetical protein [Solirubrobacteraceae bacterium]
MDHDQIADPDSHDDADQQSILSSISSEMVRIYKDQFGRGPTRTRTNWSGSDTIVVTLEETFTPAERRLREMGEHERLRDLRLLFQYAESARFCEPVERLTGRTVRAFVSGMDTVADVATELFVLHPAGDDGTAPSTS